MYVDAWRQSSAQPIRGERLAPLLLSSPLSSPSPSPSLPPLLSLSPSPDSSPFKIERPYPQLLLSGLLSPPLQGSTVSSTPKTMTMTMGSPCRLKAGGIYCCPFAPRLPPGDQTQPSAGSSLFAAPAEMWVAQKRSWEKQINTSSSQLGLEIRAQGDEAEAFTG